MRTGYVTEIYSTLQGEGLSVGERQIFVRLAGCPLRCVWCDTPGSLTANGHPAMTAREVLARVRALAVGASRTVSLTGGEPLAQAEFLREVAAALKRARYRVHLETAGVHPAALRRVVKLCDVIAMDIKLPSAVGRAFWKEHAEFLRIAGKKAFVKIILSRTSPDAELAKALALVAGRRRQTPVILQPVTPRRGLKGQRVKPPSPSQISRWYDLAKKKLADVRVQVQMHPIWGIP